MKPLGNLSNGVRRMATRAHQAVLGCGEVAVFLNRQTRRAAAVPYTAPGYARVLQSHATHLVGVYRDDLGDNDGLVERMVDDLVVHAKARRAVSA